MTRLMLSLVVLLAGSVAAAEPLALQKGDHVSIIGNTLPDRMQHDGWLETYIQGRFPELELSFRNLGFSGDEIDLRLRSSNFGSPDHWLTKTGADVVFAFFGYNESFAGKAGIENFKKQLDGYLKHLKSQKYNGAGAPRVVLFSPIAHEKRNDPNLPAGAENNKRLALYTAAMAEVAAANGATFVDLYRPTLALYDQTAEPLTINGVHLNALGNQLVGQVIDRSLFAGQAAQQTADQLEKIRAAVLDKNFHWFNRYRTVDGYSIYGGRADLKFTNGQTNRVVMEREMEVLDIMTANRDKKIWAVAQGKDYTVKDDNLPPFIPVITNKPGEGPNGEHLFLGGEEAIAKMTVADGMKVNLFASEEMFPELVNPVQMAWDTQGRLWVAAWLTYPHWKPTEAMNDKLLILEDTDGDGRADKCATFADGLHCPTGFEFYDGGVLLAAAPDLLFLKDTDGDDKADVTRRVLSGLDSADTHHTSNSFVLDPGGALYFQEGTFHHTQVETPYQPSTRSANAGVFRYEPRSQKFGVYAAYGFANPHGHVFDRWGMDIVHDGTGAVPYIGAAFSGHTNFPHKHGRAPTLYQQRTRPCPATEILSSRHFPEELQGNLLVANVIGFLGILQYKFIEDGASFRAEEVEPILSSTDPNFRPVDMEIGPDGALYFTDWQNPIIGHMQHNLRDPSRDKTHGRVYRVSCENRPLLDSPQIDGQPVAALLELLKSPENRARYRARIELSERPTAEVIAAAEKWIAALDKNDPEYEHHMMEGLWLYQNHNVVNSQLLERMLASPDYRARAAAARVLCYWRNRVSNSLDLFRQLAADEHPRVRLEAVRAASFYEAPEAIEVVVIAEQKPTDRFIQYVAAETKKTLEPFWKEALARGEDIPVATPAGARFFLRNMKTEQLLKQPRAVAVNLELLYRPGIREEIRRESLTALAKDRGESELRVLLDAIQTIDQDPNAYEQSVVFDLVRMLSGRDAAELAKVRGELEKLATDATQPVIRQVGFVALVEVDGSVEPAWKLANSSVAALQDFLTAMPLISNPNLRAALYPKVEPLLKGLPDALASGNSSQGTYGRYVRIELPRRGTLTLAEVEVYSNGRNVARQGRASQLNTANGGVAGRALDGNTNSDWGAGGQTHTKENSNRPWWEVDLGAELPIDRIVIYNRADGLEKRLDGFTLQLLDSGRNEVFEAKNQRGPRRNSHWAREWKLEGGGPAGLVRRAAMNALISVRGKETETFHKLAQFVQNDRDRAPAIRAMQRIPRDFWPKQQAQPLLDALLAYIGKLPVEDRTTPGALDAMEFADALASLLPVDRAKAARAQLRELGVRVVRLGTVPERMSYDKTIVAVKAGKPVEFIFENFDLMPHNFVIAKPGTLEELGLLAEATAQSPDAARRDYVPVSDSILLASRLLQPRDVQKLSFQAPKQPGVYPYVCTYPGHWRRMYGALYVVEDLDAYLADPEAYLTSHPLEIKDALLKDNRPRTEWKFVDLAGSVKEMEHGRSFEVGKRMFKVATCVACHKLNGEGQEFGPDLAKLDPKYQPVDVLAHILDPSKKIVEEYQTYNFILLSGKVQTGMILKETKDAFQVIENPLVAAKPTVIKKSEIDERVKSPVSMMPKGLLDKLTREEILDLVAYISAKGNADDHLFHGGDAGRHHHH